MIIRCLREQKVVICETILARPPRIVSLFQICHRLPTLLGWMAALLP